MKQLYKKYAFLEFWASFHDIGQKFDITVSISTFCLVSNKFVKFSKTRQ